MNNYQVKDYSSFSDAISSTKTLENCITSVQDAINSAKKVLSDTSVFQGPAQENCMQIFQKLESDFQSITQNYGQLSNLLSETSSSYQAGDQNAANTILNATESTSSITTTNLNSAAKTTITNKKMSIPSDPTIAAKKQQWLGDVDDKSQYTYYQGDNLFSRRNHLEVFDNTTGEVFSDGGVVNMKPGETRVLTVKLPTDTGMINQITRTTADGNAGYRAGNVITAKSDIDPDPNNIEWVRMVEGVNHKPSDMSLLHNNSYDWILTAHNNGSVTASQTCLWSSDLTKGRNLKAMVDIKVNVQ